MIAVRTRAELPDDRRRGSHRRGSSNAAIHKKDKQEVRSSEKEHKADALALGAEEGRDKLRNIIFTKHHSRRSRMENNKHEADF